MPKLQVERSVEINAPAADVFPKLVDFREWPTWSPWLIAERDATLEFSDHTATVGAWYTWSGDIVGQGKLTHERIVSNQSIDAKLDIIKPFKSSSRIRLLLEGSGDLTKVTWQMDGSLPWFLFFLKRLFTALIGLDYERGLLMLKEYVETGGVESSIDLIEVTELPEMEVAGIHDDSVMDEIGSKMGAAFDRVKRAVPPESLEDDAELVSVYLKTSDVTKHYFDFVSGYSGSRVPMPDNFTRHNVPARRYIRVRHTGAYQHLGNGWSTAISFSQAKKLKMAKAEGIEIYRNQPENTSSGDLITDIYLPIR